MKSDNNAKAYWSATLGLLTKVLVVWFLVSYGAGILFAAAAQQHPRSVAIRWASGLPSKAPSTCSSH